tara:strand:+ start:4084 stop:4227 length:144 start_codon:yes stop_codon:yes gene_type:complete
MGKRTGFVASMVECDICTHKWTAVFPYGAEKLECPNCLIVANFDEID